MLTPDFEKTTLFVRPGITDMRKQISGLSVIIQEEMERDPSPSVNIEVTR
jgi:hypothetical protein